MGIKGHRAAASIVALVLLASCSTGEETIDLDASADASASVVAQDGDLASPNQEPEPAATLERFSKRKAMIHVRKLATKIGVRVKAGRNETRAARYIKRKFESFGYIARMQRFSVDGSTSRNVVARWPGAKKYPFVVGGHIDSVPGSPGANDNASGVAVVLEMARIFAGTEQSNFITFVGFGSEEYGENRTHHDGSRHFVAKLGNTGRSRLAGALSVDMVADGRPLLVGHSDIAHKPIVARTVYNKIRKAGIDVDFITLCDCSDHGPFEHAGIPAGFAYSGREPDYHSPTDTPPNLKPDDLMRTGRAVRAFLRHLDKAMLDRFRQA